MGKELLVIGRLGAPKGLRGDLKIQSYSGESEHFHKLRQVQLRQPSASSEKGSLPEAIRVPASPSKPSSLNLKVLRVEGSAASLTIAFEGYPSPEKARELTGMELWVPREEAAALSENEWYVDDLIGLQLFHEGKAAGRVRAVLDGGADPWLEVVVASDFGSPVADGLPRSGPADKEGRVALVPFRKEFVGAVDVAAGTIELLAPWLLEE